MNHFSASFLITLLLVVNSVFGSFARVESMGKHATFFMDDVSIFDNPANINVFPNFLIGEMGSFLPNPLDTMNSRGGLNMDPQNPWFGGIFSYSMGNKDEGEVYPQISFAGAFNRSDDKIFEMLPDSVNYNTNNDVVVVPKPATNFDGFLGMTLANGGMIGGHVYVAAQDGADLQNGEIIGGLSSNISTYVYKGNLGLNWPIKRNIDGEVSVGGSIIKFGPSAIDPEWSFSAKARAFITFELIKGELVPIINYSNLNIPGQVHNEFNTGLGVNASLDRGFFWLGMEYTYATSEYSNYSPGLDMYRFRDQVSTKVEHKLSGARISFGIERNIWWDWLVIRVGGMKIIGFKRLGDQFYIYTNPISNGTPNDHIGFGIGLNIEEKLKVDATLAEDFIYTGGNLLSTQQSHVISRISATYSF